MYDELLKWFDERIAEQSAQKKALTADSRSDEATFAQIRINVLNIFRTVYTALGGSRELLLDRLEKIPAAWAQSLVTATTHGDDEKVHIERIKLKMAETIRRFVLNMEE